ncbi:hypothetical protein F5Y18DRAFT_215907 [Xylariaceae sp. FL1019]|nr:hypothetical protein F5Y18DRAFT_215907 [Xylariaceae sp. FL1019]
MAPAISRTSAEPTLYEILSLPPKNLEGQASSAQQKAVKHAYHKALLKHHPDKNQLRDSSSSPPPSASTKTVKSQSKSTSIPKSQLTYTVDQIQHAYNVLSDATQRREYDRNLLLTSTSRFSSSSHTSTHISSSSNGNYTTSQKHSLSTRFHTGIETVDLDDLGFDESTGIYYGSCRCGNERGFQFTEAQLEEYEEDRVLMVQCLDCSLWMRVLFDTVVDSQDESDQVRQPQPSSSKKEKKKAPNADVGVRNNKTEAAEQRRSSSGSGSGKGWKFNFSFNWGVSLSGGATANATTKGGA